MSDLICHDRGRPMLHACEPSPLFELAAIEEIQDRIDLVAENLTSREFSFRAIDPWQLAELLGLDLDGTSGWSRTYWVRRHDPDRDFMYPCAESAQPAQDRVTAVCRGRQAAFFVLRNDTAQSNSLGDG